MENNQHTNLELLRCEEHKIHGYGGYCRAVCRSKSAFSHANKKFGWKSGQCGCLIAGHHAEINDLHCRPSSDSGFANPRSIESCTYIVFSKQCWTWKPSSRNIVYLKIAGSREKWRNTHHNAIEKSIMNPQHCTTVLLSHSRLTVLHQQYTWSILIEL